MLLLSQLALVAALTRPSACPSALRSGCAAVPPPRLLLQQPQLAAGHCCRTAPLLHGRVAAQLRAPPVVMKSAEANEDKPGMNTNALKYLVLTLLVLQNSLTAILARASRLPSPAGSQLYLGSVAVFTAEVIKLPVCIALIARDTGGVRPMLRSIWEQVFVNWRDTLKMAVPALCYCLQNALFFVALSRLSATSYQLWSQSKTLFTAAFFVLYLGQTLRKQQWAALVLLTAGVGLVQYYEAGGAVAAAAMGAAGAGAFSTTILIGVGAVLASSLLSGFANVYFEKVIKTRAPTGEKPPTIWMRNVQLGLFSLPQAASLMAADSAIIAEHGVFVGFNLLTWTVVTLKALGGLLVAAVVKYADNVLKTYATAIAIVLTCVVSCVGSWTAPSRGFLQGMSMVIASILMYNLGPPADKKQDDPPPTDEQSQKTEPE